MALHALSSDESAAPLPTTAQVLSNIGAGPGRRRRRWLGWTLALAIVGGTGWWFFGRPAAPVVIDYDTVPAEVGNIETHVVATGSLQALSVVSVGAELSGRVESVTVDINARVSKDQVLVTLAPETFKNALNEAQASLKSANSDITRSKASLSASEVLSGRADRLASQGLVSAEEDDTQRTAKELAAADVARAKAQAALAKIKVDQAKTDLGKLVIKSPIDGVVLTRTVEPGNAISASMSTPVLFTIAEDLGKMELQLPIHESDVSRVKAGQKATFTVDAWPDRKFDATVVDISYSPVVTNNVVTYTAMLSVDNTDLALRPGMTATATIVADTTADVLRVPSAALRYTPPKPEQSTTINPFAPPRMRGGGRGGPPGMGGGQKTEPPGVWVLRDGEPVRVRVTPGVTDGAFTEVKDGELKAGDEIVVGATRGGK
ncbi:MAG TPA: efflux RND transporter periplasmic adaptor subunit [Nannocystaceae bacterium]|nr:efflux RND transporter periplasmic adaptor subunit [Nannocystaceae bacterium]